MLNKNYYKDKKIIVTGGAGFIGSNLVERLVELGADILVIDDLSVGKYDNFTASVKAQIKFEKISILDLASIKNLFKGYEMVFHLATQCIRLSINNPFTVNNVNTTGTLNICQAALENNLSKIIYVSSSEVYGNTENAVLNEQSITEPTTIYGASKLAGEYYVKAFYRTHGLPYIIIRPFNNYGPKSHLTGVYGEVIPRFILQLLNNMSPTIFGDGNQTRDFTFVTECVEMLLMLAQYLNLTVNCAYGNDVSINQIAQSLTKILNKPMITPVYIGERPADIKKLKADITLMKQVINYTPTIDIETGLKSHVDWFLKNYKNHEELLQRMPLRNWELTIDKEICKQI